MSKVIELRTERVVPIRRDRQLELDPATLINDIKPELDEPWVVPHNGKMWLCFGLTLVVKFERRNDTIADMDNIYVYVRRSQARPYNGKHDTYPQGYILPEGEPLMPPTHDVTTKMSWDEAMSIAPLGTPIKEVIQKIAERETGQQMVRSIIDQLNAHTLASTEAKHLFTDVVESGSDEPKDVIYE